MKNRLAYAAIALWKKHGYENISINDICAELNVTKGSFYHHFTSKDSLLLHYFHICCEENMPSVIEKSFAEPSYINKILILLGYLTEISVDMGSELISVLIKADMTTHESEYRRSIASVLSLATAACKQGRLTGEIRNDYSAEALMQSIQSSFTGLLFYWSAYGESFDLLEKQSELIRIILTKS